MRKDKMNESVILEIFSFLYDRFAFCCYFLHMFTYCPRNKLNNLRISQDIDDDDVHVDDDDNNSNQCWMVS